MTNRVSGLINPSGADDALMRDSPEERLRWGFGFLRWYYERNGRSFSPFGRELLWDKLVDSLLAALAKFDPWGKASFRIYLNGAFWKAKASSWRVNHMQKRNPDREAEWPDEDPADANCPDPAVACERADMAEWCRRRLKATEWANLRLHLEGGRAWPKACKDARRGRLKRSLAKLKTLAEKTDAV